MEILSGIFRFLLASAVSLLPERVKERPNLQALTVGWVHVLSGAAEAALCSLLFVHGLAQQISDFSLILARRAAKGEVNVGDAMFLNILAYLEYISSPLGCAYLYGFGEGLFRMAITVIGGRRPGSGILSLALTFYERFTDAGRRMALERKLGPARADRVVAPERSKSGLLEIYSRDPKPWSERQAVQHEERYYLLAEREVAAAGAHHWHVYRLRPMQPGDMIRGSLVRYPEAVP